MQFNRLSFDRCFLYLVNYARMKPEIALKALPILTNDLNDVNPLIRALALRTLSYVHVRQFVEATVEPLKLLLQDPDPYVRKTAALCVAKLFDLNPALAIEEGFIETLQEMIGDSNPMVVANAVTALAEISEAAPETRALVVTSQMLKKMLLALNECTEWGRITILTTLDLLFQTSSRGRLVRPNNRRYGTVDGDHDHDYAACRFH